MVLRGEAALESFLQQTHRLYTIPTVAVEVLSLADDPTVDLARLRRCVERDPALTAKLLRIVNGSMFGLGRKVSQLNEAIGLLGIKTLKLLALGFSLPQRLFESSRSDELRRYWRRTLTRAAAARELARRLPKVDPDEAFLVALLSDLGALLLLQQAADKYLPIYRDYADDARALRAIERETFGFDHATLTARLFADWHLPPHFSQTILSAANDEESPQTPLVATLRAAGLFAAVAADERADLWPALHDVVARQYSLDDAEMERLAEMLDRQVEGLAEELQLSLPKSEAYRDVLERSHRLMSTAAEEVVADWLTQGSGKPIVAAHAASPNAAAPGSASPTSASAAEGTFEVAARREVETRIREVAAACRNVRSPFGLCLIAADRRLEQPVANERRWQAAVAAVLAIVCRKVAGEAIDFLPLADGRAVVFLPGFDRKRSLDSMSEVRRRFPNASSLVVGRTTLSIGVAAVNVPPRDPPVEEILSAAERCLNAARSAAGNIVKSIELF